MSTTDFDGSESGISSVKNTTTGEETSTGSDRTEDFRITTPAVEVTIIERWNHGMTWMAHPEAQMQRASHALVVNDDVWLVDPLDAGDLDDELAELGTVTGVVVLGSKHHRHADRLAARHDVSIHPSAWFEEEATDFDTPVVPSRGSVRPDSSLHGLVGSWRV